jgi:hypothetical protein
MFESRLGVQALVYFSLTAAALVFFWLGPRTLLHCRSLQRAPSSNALNIRPVEKGGKNAALVRMKSASSPDEGKLAFRLKAFGIVSKTASTLLSIFVVTNGEASDIYSAMISGTQIIWICKTAFAHTGSV